MSSKRLCLYCVVSLFSLPLLTGCGDSPSPAVEANSSPPDLGSGSSMFDGQEDPNSGGLSPLPTASIPAAVSQATNTVATGDPDDGSPEWQIREISRLRTRAAPQTEDVERLGNHRRWKNERIVEHAQAAIALTHTDPAKETLFNTAALHLMEARLQLAVQAGPKQTDSERTHVEELYNDAESFYRRDPKSKAAADAAFVRARFTNMSADRFAKDDSRWLEEFARQARLFAGSFPEETERAAKLLDAAGRSCELNGLQDEAVNCYTLLSTTFGKGPEGQQATAVLRRLQLNGERLQSFAGPTVDGGYTRIDDFQGRIVVIAFWASHSRQCVEQIPRLTSLVGKWGNSRVVVLGVNLDDDKPAVERFLKGTDSARTTIFWPDTNRRSWKNPIVQYYGIRDIPMYWLVDADGIVVNTLLDLDGIEKEVGQLVNKN